MNGPICTPNPANANVSWMGGFCEGFQEGFYRSRDGDDKLKLPRRAARHSRKRCPPGYALWFPFRHPHDDHPGSLRRLALGALAVGGCARINISGNLGGTHEADCTDCGVIQDGIHAFTRAVHHVNHAFGETALVDQFKNTLHGHRHPFGWFDDVGVPGGQCIGEEPESDHPGEIEGQRQAPSPLVGGS